MPGEKTILEGIESFFLPEFNKVEGELKGLNAKYESLKNELGSVRNEIGSVRNELKTDISRVEGTLREEIAGVRIELKALSEKVDLVREVEKLKLRVQELEQGRR